MYSLRFVTFILWSFILTIATAQHTADKAANAKTQQILTYIANLPQQGKVLSGQFAGYSPDTFSTSQIDEITRQTGQVPAILGCDWACGWNYKTPPEYLIDYSCNPALKNHWNKGGLVTINMHLPNPANANGGGYKDRGNLNFADLINTNTETGQRWRKFLDRMALGLDDLQRAGVTVLFRPLHEMNGDWFYWCNQDPEVFKNVWRNMFSYLTTTKQLHNLLWVFSPDQSRANPSRYYPGDAYVDIVGLDAYVDDPYAMNGYNEMINLNKPFGLAELGPSNKRGQFDYTQWIGAIQNKFPRVAYFFAWNDDWSPIRNPNAYAFFTNSRLVNLAQLNLGGQTGGTGTSSAVLYSFSNGVGQWKGSNLVGGPWQVSDFVFKSTDSLKADVRLTAGGRYTLLNQDPNVLKLSGKKSVTAQARVASWGFSSTGSMTATLYVKVGSAWTWYDSGFVQLNSSNFVTLTLDLTKISTTDLSNVRELGIDFVSSENGSQSSVYIAYITAEA